MGIVFGRSRRSSSAARKPKSPSPAELERRNRQINQSLQAEKRDNVNVIKILLLGTAGCGKSTIFKQMRIIHLDGFSEIYIGHCRALIQNNAINSIQQIIREADARNLPITDAEMEEFKLTVRADRLTIHELNPELAKLIDAIWRHPIIRDLYNHRDEFELLDSAKYFLDRVCEICSPDYRPTDEDILRSRIATTGATQIQFPYRTTQLKMTDVGGNRSEMKKWVHFFDNVETVLFISALSDYDQYSNDYEVPINKLTLSLEVFERICLTGVFHDAAIILFLNKIDLFEEKIGRRLFSDSHTHYSGPCDSETVRIHIQNSFVEIAELTGHIDKLYAHCTNATDTSNVQKVFDISMDVIIEENMKGSGFT